MSSAHLVGTLTTVSGQTIAVTGDVTVLAAPTLAFSGLPTAAVAPGTVVSGKLVFTTDPADPVQSLTLTDNGAAVTVAADGSFTFTA
jgi:hypothetical protein